MSKAQDIGCPDFERAKLNREIVANKLYTSAYIEVENALAGLAVSSELPYWILKGNLPYIDIKELINLMKHIENDTDE